MSRKIVPKKKTHAEYENQLMIREINFFPVEKYINDRTPILHECSEGHQWKVRPSNILTGQGCPDCYKTKRAKTHLQYCAEISIDAAPIEEYKGVKTKIIHKCSNGHEWPARPDLILSGHGCPKCWAKSKTRSHQEYVNKIPKTIEVLEEYINETTKIKHKCLKGHVWETQPRSILSGHGCPKCNLVGGYNKTRFAKDRELADSPGILYSVILVNKQTHERCCIKVGITRGTSNKDVLKRAAGFKGYEPRIQKLCFGTLEKVFELEQFIHNKFAEYHYTSDWAFGGHTELFEISKLREILKSIPNEV